MILPLAGIVVGLVVLTYAAEHFVMGAARLAAFMRLSPVVIGAVVIGFGTSAPEMVVSGLASGQGLLDIAAGNIIGSNVANLSLVLGAASMVMPLAVGSPTLRREAPISLASVLLFAMLVQGGLTRTEAAIAGVALVAALTWILYSSRGPDVELSAEVEEYLDEEHHHSIWRESLRTFVGLGLTLGAAQILVASASTVADELGLAEGFVGLTIIALGTSLPELATSLQAARKNEPDLIIGNLLGSNIFNSLAVSAVAGLVGPGPLGDEKLAGIGTILMVVVAVAATFFMATGRTVKRWEGAVLLVLYVGVVPLLA